MFDIFQSQKNDDIVYQWSKSKEEASKAPNLQWCHSYNNRGLVWQMGDTRLPSSYDGVFWSAAVNIPIWHRNTVTSNDVLAG